MAKCKHEWKFCFYVGRTCILCKFKTKARYQCTKCDTTTTRDHLCLGPNARGMR